MGFRLSLREPSLIGNASSPRRPAAWLLWPGLLLLAAACFLRSEPRGSQAQTPTRNCPVATDQLVLVTPGQPAVIHLDVFNAEGSDVSIFQYPLGGSLTPTGPTQLDYVFVPTRYFAGTTTLTYRVSSPFGCQERTQLRTVTLAGGSGVGTGGGLAISDPANGACGTTTFPLLAGQAAGLICYMSGRRRSAALCGRRRRGTPA